MLTTPLAISDPVQSTFCLPEGYVANANVPRTRLDGFWTPTRLRETRKFQHHVYRWAASFVRRQGLTSVLDVGCGCAWKLQRHILPLCEDVTGADTAHALEAARGFGVRCNFVEIDLEQPRQAWRTVDLVICADVLEHLDNPDPALALCRDSAGDSGLVLLSTPERHRLRGRAAMACTKPDHVREWSRAEFLSYLRSRGLLPVRSRLFPQDDAAIHRGLLAEGLFRSALRDRSPWACHAVLCRTDAATMNATRDRGSGDQVGSRRKGESS